MLHNNILQSITIYQILFIFISFDVQLYIFWDTIVHVLLIIF